MNIDYAVCESLSSMPKSPRVVAIYDVACQWSRNFKHRVQDNKYLNVPAGLQVIPAVGKWHLGAHIASCFPKFSLNFIPGIGQVDGEILETLWSNTNKSAGATRAMGKSHRAEVLDEIMYDSNWKKWVGIGEPVLITFIWASTYGTLSSVSALAHKYTAAKAALKVVQVAFTDLTSAVGDRSWIQQWVKLEAQAMEKRGEAMMIYNVTPIKGVICLFLGCCMH